jgi:hypothetical protein
MTEDERLVTALRTALPPVTSRGPERDLWPLVEAHGRTRPSWPWLDIGLAAAAVATFLLRPDLLVLFAYHF